MTMEIQIANEWLYATLSADAALMAIVSDRIYEYPAPKSATYPLVAFQFQDGQDLMVVNAMRVWSNLLYLVRGVSKSDSAVEVKNIADRIEAVLHRAGGSGVAACMREAPFRMVEVIDPVKYQHMGGLYRIYAQE
jgi:hypothetical protein